jgi:uncharacterized membrane protein
MPFGRLTGSEQVAGSPDAFENGTQADLSRVKFVDVSGDGNSALGYDQVIVGGNVLRKAWVFTSTGATKLTNPNGYASAMAEEISANGSVVVGFASPTSHGDTTGHVAVKWSNGTPAIRANPDGSAWYKAVAVSGDGRVVAGSTANASVALWTDDAAPEVLATSASGLPDILLVNSLSYDGSAFSVVQGNGKLVTAADGKFDDVRYAGRWTRQADTSHSARLRSIRFSAAAMPTTFQAMAIRWWAMRGKAPRSLATMSTGTITGSPPSGPRALG